LSLLSLDDGREIRRLYPDIIMWCAERYADRLVAGGEGCCVIVDKENSRCVAVGGATNMVWRTALDSSGALWIGASEGLFRLKSLSGEAQHVAAGGTCVKTVAVAPDGKLWVGLFRP
jgi:ligand-binding sensor domain-containing protein